MTIELLPPDLFQRWKLSESGLFLPPRPERIYGDRPIGIDLFCGAGGFSLGFIAAGWRVVAAVDNEVICMETYMYNLGTYPCELHFIEPSDRDRAEKELTQSYQQQGWMNKSGDITEGKNINDGIVGKSGKGPWTSGGNRPPDQPGVPHFFLGDVRKLDGKEMLRKLGLEPGEVDCVFGGPPCQGFSTSGRQDVMDPRNSLVFEFARMVMEIQPKTICMENVPGMINMVTPEGVPVLDAFCRLLSEGGFGQMEALKRSLMAHPNMGAAMKGTHRPKYKGSRDGSVTGLDDDEVDDASEPVEQMSFLGGMG